MSLKQLWTSAGHQRALAAVRGESGGAASSAVALCRAAALRSSTRLLAPPSGGFPEGGPLYRIFGCDVIVEEQELHIENVVLKAHDRALCAEGRHTRTHVSDARKLGSTCSELPDFH